jgi:hypothetical protein
MSTPIYNGRGQPNPGNGGWLGSWLGGTPTYQGVGQPAQKSSPLLGGSQPVYKPAASDAMGQDANACGPFAIVIPRQVIEPQQ